MDTYINLPVNLQVLAHSLTEPQDLVYPIDIYTVLLHTPTFNTNEPGCDNGQQRGFERYKLMLYIIYNGKAMVTVRQWYILIWDAKHDMTLSVLQELENFSAECIVTAELLRNTHMRGNLSHGSEAQPNNKIIAVKPHFPQPYRNP